MNAPHFRTRAPRSLALALKAAIVRSFHLTFTGHFAEWLTSALQYAYLTSLFHQSASGLLSWLAGAAPPTLAGFSGFYSSRSFRVKNCQVVHVLLLCKEKVS